ncbi:SRPBCC family protein [Nocardia harenae]|uniref:SRPBCC family protein n=1 Tax=Nocardia harenae TaxID=358707 RepID=UPI001C3FE876|nr:SRPBCC domain-containing protein [Nocardia harenae]
MVVIERGFAAPVEVIWRMWTVPEHFAAWYGPGGASVPVARMDVRVGGARLVCMRVETRDGARRMWFAGEYLEVVENERLVYTESVSDEDGRILTPAEAGTPPGHPVTTEVRVQLRDVGGRTEMVLTHRGVPAGSPAASGWSAALDKLAAHIE